MVESKIRKDLVNEILKQFAIILQSYKPNIQELELIQAKINSLVERNRSQAKIPLTSKSHSIHEGKISKEEKWYRIKIE